MGECSILNLFTFMLSLGNRVFGFSELISEIWPELWSAAPETSALCEVPRLPCFLNSTTSLQAGKHYLSNIANSSSRHL